MSGDTRERVVATARMVATIEVDVTGGGWGPECSVAQVHRQARDNCVTRLSNVMHREGGMRLVGEPVINMITIPEK